MGDNLEYSSKFLKINRDDIYLVAKCYSGIGEFATTTMWQRLCMFVHSILVCQFVYYVQIG